ncbi:hypothetical protein [Roseovarius aestuarii]|uniref:hypothetical protein n=1 Tax=Roseovarius aestuarii TaxID=475083 RepID=UPI000A26CC2D
MQHSVKWALSRPAAMRRLFAVLDIRQRSGRWLEAAQSGRGFHLSSSGNVNLLQVLGLQPSIAKAVIHRPEFLTAHAAVSTNGRNAQKADFSKSAT